jgi:hypothetical protein
LCLRREKIPFALTNQRNGEGQEEERNEFADFYIKKKRFSRDIYDFGNLSAFCVEFTLSARDFVA